MKELDKKAWLSVVLLLAAMGLVLFITAWSIYYWQGWVYLALFVGISGMITHYLMRHDPALLERRMKGGPTAEKRPIQKLIMLFNSIGFIALLVIPALDFRHRWSCVPVIITILGDLLVITGFSFIFRVYKENPYSSATIEVVEGQKLVTTGPYAIVRHPMYASAFLYLIGTPLALGSYWGLLVILIMLPFLLWRLLDEERFLSENLQGYEEYKKHVRYRLIPFIW